MSSTIRVSILLAACAAVLAAAEIRGTVLDPSDAAIPNAQVSAVSRVGVIAQTLTDPAGTFGRCRNAWSVEYMTVLQT